MIDTRQLRVGNIINEKKEYYGGKIEIIETVVENISEDGINYFYTVEYGGLSSDRISVDNMIGIEINEEWLTKLGFARGKEERYRNVFYFERLSFAINDNQPAYTNYFGEFCKLPIIQFVHQLQNLYFALTGVELTVKVDAVSKL